jgi:hypothetical protein
MALGLSSKGGEEAADLASAGDGEESSAPLKALKRGAAMAGCTILRSAAEMGKFETGLPLLVALTLEADSEGRRLMLSSPAPAGPLALR